MRSSIRSSSLVVALLVACAGAPPRPARLDVADFRAAFDAASDHPRAIVALSPT